MSHLNGYRSAKEAFHDAAICHGATPNRSSLTRLRRSSGARSARRHSSAGGFTIVELLIVASVIMIIMALAIPNLMSALQEAKIARSVSDIRSLEDEVTLYVTINGRLPDSLAQVGYGSFHDPYGSLYQYFNHLSNKGNGMIRLDRFGVPLNDDYDLYSLGKDTNTSASISAGTSQDDIIRGADGSYVGPAAQF